MPIVSMDQAFVRSAQCPDAKSKIDYYDQAITGFMLEVRHTGGKTYYLRYRDDRGKLRQHKIGDAKSLTYDKARQVAQRLRSRVVLGENPAEDRKVLRTIPTLLEVVEQRYIPNIQQHRRNYSSTLSFLHKHLLPALGHLHLDEITPEKISEVHVALRDSGYALATANRLPIFMKTIYNLCRRQKVPGATPNPANEVQLFQVNNARERFLTPEEIQRLREALELSENPQLRYIVPLLLLLGCRKRELLDARWEYVDLERRLLYVPLSKSGKPRNIPLSLQAMEMFKQLPRWKGCPFVIPNPKTLKPYVSLYEPWHVARKRAGLEDVRIHDLRHTAASMLVQANIPIYTVSKILGHTQLKTTERYSHLADDTLLAAADTAASAMANVWATSKSSAV